VARARLKYKQANGHGNEDILDMVLTLRQGNEVTDNDDANSRDCQKLNKVNNNIFFLIY